MGARASVILVDSRGDESPVLCQHWGGSQFHDKVCSWAIEQFLKNETNGNITDRWSENGRIFVRLVQAFGELGYVGRTRNEVDDSDYGCLQVTLGDDGPTFKVLS